MINLKQLIKKQLNNFLFKGNLIILKKHPLSNLITKNNIIIIAPARSGSTFLLDSLRGHPLIEMMPNNFFHTLLLNNHFNRYPSDLKNSDNCNLPIIDHVWNDKIDMIPSFKLDLDIFKDKEKKYPKELAKNYYNIEKIHPTFINFNLDIFNNNISQLKNINKKINLKFIYLIRDPIEIINSIYNYNDRNHEWSSAQVKNVNLLFDVQTKSLKFIEDSRKIFPGLLIDYSYLKEKYTVTILKIFEFLWEHNKDLNNLNLEVSNKINFLTNRSTRINIKNKFFGKEEGLINMNPKTKYLLENNKIRIDELLERYIILKNESI